MTRALAARFDRVIAIDISHEMLAEARRNLAHRSNVVFEHAGSVPTGSEAVDFILSKIVFQHIPPTEGLCILGSLLRRLSGNGAGVIDFPIRYSGGTARRMVRGAKRLWPFGEPLIPVYVYSLRDIEAVVRDAGLSRLQVRVQQVPRFENAIVAFGR